MSKSSDMRIFLVSAALFISALADCQVKKQNAETVIQNVIIFSSGARIERRATVNIPSGRSELLFTGLSNQLEQQTVQLTADANITLLSVQTTKDFMTGRRIEQEERDLSDHINSLEDKIGVDQKLLDVYRNEEAMLVKNQEIGGQTGVKTTDLKEALEFQRQRLTEVYGKQLEIQKRLALQKQELQKNSAQLHEIGKKRDSINYIVTALIESREARPVNFKLFYNIKDAGWYPTYDVRVTDIAGPLTVLMNANIFQRSGETWKNIPLQLSTGNPGDNATPSQLNPWMLGFYDPLASSYTRALPGEASGRVTNDKGEPLPGASVTVKGSSTATVTDNNGYFRMGNLPKNSVLSISYIGYQSRQVAPGAYLSVSLTPMTSNLDEVVVVGYGALESRVPGLEIEDHSSKRKAAIQPVTTITQYQPTTMVYRVDDRYTLESDGKTTTVGIRQLEVPALYDYYSAPKIDPAAFLTARIVNWQELDLQSGEASLYFEGTYLGKTYIDLAAADDTLSLSLGKDNGIKITRKLLKEYSTKKFIGSTRTDSRQYELVIHNTKRTAVNISLLDQIPVSATREISIEDSKATDAQIDKETGIVTWKMTLAPGEEKKAGLSYSVKYPKDRRLVLE